MDINHLEVALASNSADPNSIYTFVNPRQQAFSFRWPIIKYILKNPTGKAWNNLVQTCKYFFPKYPVFPVQRLTHAERWEADGKEVILTEKISKLWLFDVFDCWDYYSTVTEDDYESISEICKCDIRSIRFNFHDLTWENYKILTSSSSLKTFCSYESRVKYSDGKYVTVDKLLEKVEHIEEFKIFCKSRMFENETVKKLAMILPSFKNLRILMLSNLDKSFDLSSFMDFLMKNETISVHLNYVNNLYFSDAYKQMLETCFGQLLANPPKKLPIIAIYGFDGKQYQEYVNLMYS